MMSHDFCYLIYKMRFFNFSTEFWRQVPARCQRGRPAPTIVVQELKDVHLVNRDESEQKMGIATSAARTSTIQYALGLRVTQTADFPLKGHECSALLTRATNL